jgi:hypothetical protein
MPPTQNPTPPYKTMYDDIAVDKYNNIWYVTEPGDLYKRKLSDTSSCQYLGNFTPNHRPIKALVADSVGDIYAICNWYDSTRLMKYDATGFHSLGFLPKNVYSNGDLFFYEHRLFLLSYYLKADSSFITEIVIKDPSQSCYYMSLDTLMTFGAFTIKDNNKSRVFATAVDKYNILQSYLYEIDIPNKKILGPTCTYPLFIRGAASYYELTSDSTQCHYIPQSIKNVEKANQITVLNPCTERVRIKTVLLSSEISRIELYSLSGIKIKIFDLADFPNNLDISEIATGIYVLQVRYQDDSVQCLKLHKN